MRSKPQRKHHSSPKGREGLSLTKSGIKDCCMGVENRQAESIEKILYRKENNILLFSFSQPAFKSFFSSD
jgi:hypothetical protein